MISCNERLGNAMNDELLDSALSKDQQIIQLTIQVDELNEWVWEDRIVMFICGLVVGLGAKAVWFLWL